MLATYLEPIMHVARIFVIIMEVLMGLMIVGYWIAITCLIIYWVGMFKEERKINKQNKKENVK